jgi:hypothetical protein
MKMVVNGGYLYAAGSDDENAILMKIDMDTLDIISQKRYDYMDSDYFSDMIINGQYIYAVGESQNASPFVREAIIAKADKDSLDLVASRNVYNGDYYLNSLAADNDYIYAAGSDMQDSEARIIRFNASDFDVASVNSYQGAYNISSMTSDSGYLYANDSLNIIKIAKSDMSVAAARRLDSGDSSEFYPSVALKGSYIYRVGVAGSQSGSLQAVLSSLPSGSYSSSPSGFDYRDVVISASLPSVDVSDNSPSYGDYLTTEEPYTLILDDAIFSAQLYSIDINQ